ncbi:peptidoglycan bridge formation glycyltransferase FemA/FemB family protein [Candidatus Peregrinibacteria bacterium]|jgi:peptidoglycan pentaglycine glycine transferase (the first glycine)|nr:peptidoglycan bridge formation glycyltransferase FemA/FemB family protein [Candidatus Peregrinibacteria bacterium]MBT4631782.1 peptidoglycan bridge formation glycyltransferase FemA/FemB family protein [Candidatus Peregrinibacteria bacterium]MBT5516845.1 peptidoglycan bridge formation glycyltransferase FemA/FemB family protein [Candidatus Peregrinibacteria bacterium]MBT5824493.1 peptidoglycan bridge formation glycyltransferase FemA/FemB family protein [Candidatus Peregrinibacteria bacterium]
MEIRFIKPEEEGVLEKFVKKHRHGSIEQTFSWGVLQTSIPGRDAMFAFGVFDEEKLVASMLLIRQHMRWGKHWLWCPRGPLLPGGKKGEEAWKLMEVAARDLAKKEGDVFMRVEPGAPVGADFPLEGRAVKTSYMPQNTLLLDLKDDLEGIRKQMAQKGRYNIKQAHKLGIYVKEGGIDDLDDFYEILEETAERDGFHLHEKDFYKQFFELLGDKARLFLAHHDHDLLGGILVTYFGNTATYYFGASSNKQRQKMAPYAMQWHAIQEAKTHGMKTYDFLGVAPEGDSGHVLAGVTQFKTRFGGERIAYHKPRVFVYKSAWYWFSRAAKYAGRLLRR